MRNDHGNYAKSVGANVRRRIALSVPTGLDFAAQLVGKSEAEKMEKRFMQDRRVREHSLDRERLS